MSHSYRKERYLRRRSARKESYFRIVITVGFLIAASIIIVFQWMNANQLKGAINQKKNMIMHIEQELDILRTLNPYHVKSDAILAKAAQNVDLFPGWVTRVYPVPKNYQEANFAQDLGSFVMNETRFSMSSHKRYGIPQPHKSMYRLNGLFPNHQQGRLQVGVELYFQAKQAMNNKNTMRKFSACYVRVDINRKRVIDKRVNVVTRFQDEQVVIGDVELSVGLHPISAMIYCDKSSDFNGDDVEVSFSFRNPGDNQLVSSRHSIFHIYKPNNFAANL